MPPTLAQLEAEAWWGREIRPPTLTALGESLRGHFGVPAVAVGIKGDQAHLSGGHRSPEWIRRSQYSSRGTSDSSLVMSNGALASASNQDLRALDLTPGSWGTAENRRRMVDMTVRLDNAVRAGTLPQVRRFWGTKNRTSVYGWDAHFRQVSTSDSSHLDHLHIEMYPDRVRWDHSGVFAVLTGGDEMAGEVADFVAAHVPYQGRDIGLHVATGMLLTSANAMQAALAASAQREQDMLTAIAALASGGTSIDTAAVLARIDARTADVTGQITQLREQLDERDERIAQLQSALAEAGEALVTADDTPGNG
jgi:hypothetical protein